MPGILLAAVCAVAAWGEDGAPPSPPEEHAAAAAPSGESGTVATAPVEPAPESARARLDAAVRYYLAGEHERARAALADLLNDETVADRDVRIRARVYLGEVLFVGGNRDASWDAFRALLEDDPGHRLDPYEHPPDVVDFFETVRALRAESRPPAAPPPPPARLPLLVYAPFGAWQIANDEPGTGWTLAAVQFASGAASLWLLADLSERHETHDPEVYDTMLLKRRLSWTFTAAFYGAWVVGGLDARSGARRQRRAVQAFGVGGLPGGAEVGLALRLP